jgi:hypothetical protein
MTRRWGKAGQRLTDEQVTARGSRHSLLRFVLSLPYLAYITWRYGREETRPGQEAAPGS